LEEGVDPNAADSFGFTALEYALNFYPHTPEKDHLVIVKTLVEGGADVNARASNGQTPLFTAASEGLYDIVVYLHKQGADLNARLDTGANAFHEIPDTIVNRPLNFSITVQREGEEVTLTDPDEIRQEIGSHPDDEFEERLKTAQYLVENGIDIEAQLYEGEQTVLARAADFGAEEIVDLLLDTGKTSVDHADKWGVTALHYACRQGHYNVVNCLLQARANINAQENYGFTPLHEAAENGHLDIVRLLIAGGANPGIGLEKQYQAYPAGSTALDLAKEAGYKQVIAYLSGL
jgi:ankyrin repeat protein